MGNGHPNAVPYQDFSTRDGHMILAIGNDGQFARFCNAAVHPEWATDPRFATNPDRVAHREELLALMRELTARRGTREWVTLLEQHAVPCGPINTVADVFEGPQARARGMQIAMQHPQAGDVPLVASPINLSDTPVTYRQTPPQLGQHTDAVLHERLGLSPQAIAALRQKGILA